MMTLQGLCVSLAVALQLGCVSAFTIPHDGKTRETEGQETHLDVTKTLNKKLDELLHLKELPQNGVPPHKKAPQFMVDLFNAVADSSGSPKSQKELLDGNIVRSFEDKGHAGGKFHYFNLSSFSQEERMVKAEFRWFRQKQKLHAGSRSYGPHFYKMDVYEVLDSRVRPWRGNLLTSRLVPLYTQGWEVFNITQTVAKWVRNSEENNGLLVVNTLPSGGNWLQSASSSSADRNAYLVIFSDDGRTGTTANSSQNPPGHHANSADGHANSADGHANSADGHANSADGHAAAPEVNEHRGSSRRRRAIPSFLRGPRPPSCQRVPLFVDFEEIGWSGWIISPRGYNAYHCKGSCPFPLGESLRATNHATVQSIMHALKISSDVGTPCCVPDRLQSISLLYFDDEENVVLKQYDDMVAVSCGCH